MFSKKTSEKTTLYFEVYKLKKVKVISVILLHYMVEELRALIEKWCVKPWLIYSEAQPFTIKKKFSRFDQPISLNIQSLECRSSKNSATMKNILLYRTEFPLEQLIHHKRLMVDFSESNQTERANCQEKKTIRGLEVFCPKQNESFLPRLLSF